MMHRLAIASVLAAVSLFVYADTASACGRHGGRGGCGCGGGYGGCGWGGCGCGGYGWGGCGCCGYSSCGCGGCGWGGGCGCCGYSMCGIGGCADGSCGWGGGYGGWGGYGAPGYDGGRRGGAGDRGPGPGGDRGRDGGRTSLDNSANIVVSLPEAAKLSIDDQPTTSTSSSRLFTTPALEEGKEYTYTLKAEIPVNGQTVTVAKQVTVHAGDQAKVEIEAPTSVVER